LKCTLDIKKRNTCSGAQYSVVVVATVYRPNGPGFEPRWGRLSGPIQIGPKAHLASCTMCPFIGGKMPGARRWPPNPVLRRGRAWVELYLFLPTV